MGLLGYLDPTKGQTVSEDFKVSLKSLIEDGEEYLASLVGQSTPSTRIAAFINVALNPNRSLKLGYKIFFMSLLLNYLKMPPEAFRNFISESLVKTPAEFLKAAITQAMPEARVRATPEAIATASEGAIEAITKASQKAPTQVSVESFGLILQNLHERPTPWSPSIFLTFTDYWVEPDKETVTLAYRLALDGKDFPLFRDKFFALLQQKAFLSLFLPPASVSAHAPPSDFTSAGAGSEPTAFAPAHMSGADSPPGIALPGARAAAIAAAPLNLITEPPPGCARPLGVRSPALGPADAPALLDTLPSLTPLSASSASSPSEGAAHKAAAVASPPGAARTMLGGVAAGASRLVPAAIATGAAGAAPPPIRILDASASSQGLSSASSEREPPTPSNLFSTPIGRKARRRFKRDLAFRSFGAGGPLPSLPDDGATSRSTSDGGVLPEVLLRASASPSPGAAMDTPSRPGDNNTAIAFGAAARLTHSTGAAGGLAWFGRSPSPLDGAADPGSLRDPPTLRPAPKGGASRGAAHHSPRRPS